MWHVFPSLSNIFQNWYHSNWELIYLHHRHRQERPFRAPIEPLINELSWDWFNPQLTKWQRHVDRNLFIFRIHARNSEIWPFLLHQVSPQLIRHWPLSVWLKSRRSSMELRARARFMTSCGNVLINRDHFGPSGGDRSNRSCRSLIVQRCFIGGAQKADFCRRWTREDWSLARCGALFYWTFRSGCRLIIITIIMGLTLRSSRRWEVWHF